MGKPKKKLQKNCQKVANKLPENCQADDDFDEVVSSYAIKDGPNPELGKTHVLILKFPEACDEECFLISLKAFIRGRSQQLQNEADGIKAN